MESIEFINQSKSLLSRLENYKNLDTNQTLKDIVLDTKLMLYRYAPDFPLLNEINEITSTTIANMDNAQKLNAQKEYLSLVTFQDQANIVAVILNKFINYLESLSK